MKFGRDDGVPNGPTERRLTAVSPRLKVGDCAAGTGGTDAAAVQWQVESHLAPVLERTKAELDATRRQLAGAREQMQHLQVGFA